MNIKEKLKQHNSKTSKFSSTKTPYELVWYCAFQSKTKALEFEQYLKKGSGHAFTKKRLI